jgi:hypothetical protein
MYPAIATLIAVSNESALIEADTDKQQAFYAAAKRAIEGYCGQRFDRWDAVRVLPGNGSRELPLPVRLAEIDSLEVAGGGSSLAVTDVALSSDKDVLYVKPTADSGTWVTRVMRESRPPIFPMGHGAVTITGTWGWLDAEMPDDPTTPVGIAMRLDMEDQAVAAKHGLAETVRANQRLGLSSLAEGRVQVTQRPADITLPIDAQLVLQDYIWNPAPV